MRFRKATVLVSLFVACFVLAARSAKADDIIFNDLGDTINVSGSSAVNIILGCQQTGAANSDFCSVSVLRAGQTITGVSGGNFVLDSNSTYTLAEDPAKTLLSDTFNSTVVKGGPVVVSVSPRITFFVPGSATFVFSSDLPGLEGVPVSCPTSGCTATETGGQQEVGTITWSNGVVDHIIVESAPEPEPASLILFGSGLVIAGGFLRRRNRHAVTASV
jgi:hypothetical protein